MSPSALPTRSSLDPEAIGLLRRTIAGPYEPTRLTLTAIARRAALVDRLVADAAATLSGDSAAAGRLREALDRRLPPRNGTGLLHRSGDRGLDDQVLGTLVSGVLWAADTADQAAAMVDVALRVIEPFDAVARLSARVRMADAGGLVPDQLESIAHMADWFEAMPDDGPPLGPDDGPLHVFPKNPRWSGLLDWRPIQHDLLRPFACVLDAMRQVAEAQASGPRYRITSISPSPSCYVPRPTKTPPLITIQGSGFGVTGTVVFRSVNGPGERIEVPAVSWNDIEVQVRQPAMAASGAIELRTEFGRLELCGQEFPLFRLADALVPFESEPAAYALTVDGSTPPSILTPGTDVAVQWLASASPNTHVTLTMTRISASDGKILAGPATIVDQLGGGSGSVSLHLPYGSTIERLHLELQVSGLCPADSEMDAIRSDYLIAPRQSIEVYGVEVTQMYQNHPMTMSVPVGPLPASQRVLTAERKDTIVRVYVGLHDGGLLGDSLPGVTGRLLIDGVPLAPWLNASVTAREVVLRRPIGTTLNFRIPAAWCVGTRRLVVQVWGKDAVGRPVNAAYSLDWNWVHAHALKVRWVRIQDTRKGASPGATDQAREEAVHRAFDYLPSPPDDIARAVVPTMGTSKNPDPFGKDMSLMLDDLVELHDDADRPDELWIGVLDVGIGGLTPGGKGLKHTVLGGAEGAVIAHEIGHSRGRSHIEGSCGMGRKPSNAVPLVPADTFQVNVAVDPHAVATIDAGPGRSLGDLMSYCCVVATGRVTWEAIHASLP